MTAQGVATVVVAAINAQFSTTRAYQPDEVPSPRPAEYVEVIVSRTVGGPPKGGGVSDTQGYRVTCRAVSQTSIANVDNSLEKCLTALKGKFMTVGTGQIGPIIPEPADPPAPDDGWFSGLIPFICAL